MGDENKSLQGAYDSGQVVAVDDDKRELRSWLGHVTVGPLLDFFDWIGLSDFPHDAVAEALSDEIEKWASMVREDEAMGLEDEANLRHVLDFWQAAYALVRPDASQVDKLRAEVAELRAKLETN